MSILMETITLSKNLCQYPLQAQLAYATPNNFIGPVIDGYHADAQQLCLLTSKAAEALCHVQNDLIKNHQYGLFIYDAYRPKRAVLDFAKWAALPPAGEFELQRKALHYPHIQKNQLFDLGYIAEDSNHCYGNTVDLVLIDIHSQKFLNMGAIFDFLDETSHLTATPEVIGQDAYRHRQILMAAMVKFGYEPYIKEFWHFCHGGRAGSEMKTPMDIEITSAFYSDQER